MRSLAFLLVLIFTVLIANVICEPNARLVNEEEHVVDETQLTRATAEREALKWEAHVQKLNAEVFPAKHFSHEQLKVKTTASNTAKKHTRAFLKPSIQSKHAKPILPHAMHDAPKWHVQTADEVILISFILGLRCEQISPYLLLYF